MFAIEFNKKGQSCFFFNLKRKLLKQIMVLIDMRCYKVFQVKGNQRKGVQMKSSASDKKQEKYRGYAKCIGLFVFLYL